MDKALNTYLKKYITLDEGEEFCPNCKGKGKLPLKFDGKGLSMLLRCHVCGGEGKLDWIEKVVGKKRGTMDGTDSSPG